MSFKEEVIEIVKTIPEGRLMTYGQIAALAGSPQSSMIVGGIAHYGDALLPWHRVVNKNGHLARGYPGGINEHKIRLEEEGVKVVDYVAPINELIWWPKQ